MNEKGGKALMYTHSVTIEKEKCIGCTDCIKRCPTEAIRVRGSKAEIIEERCIDCGNCIRICRNGAKKAVMDEWELLDKYTYRVALPAPSLYAQFPAAKDINEILEALYRIGFTDCFEVAFAAEMITQRTYDYLEKATHLPVISSSCPAIVRLIQRRFPSLLPHLLPLMSPMELAARYVKKQYAERGIEEEQVGVFFISPCPAKATEIHRPKGFCRSYVDGVLSMQALYKKIKPNLKHFEGKKLHRKSSYIGLMWAMRTGSLDQHRIKSHVSVDGMENVIEILEKVEDGTLTNVSYIEALGCTGGCLGGVLTVENAFVSCNTLKKWIDEESTEQIVKHSDVWKALKEEACYFEKSITPRPVFTLDSDMEKAIAKMEGIEELYSRLPQIDCGACGAPTCRCFAEDVIKQKAKIEECVFMLREKIKDLSNQMHALTQINVPTEKGKRKKEEIK